MRLPLPIAAISAGRRPSLRRHPAGAFSQQIRQPSRQGFGVKLFERTTRDGAADSVRTRVPRPAPPASLPPKPIRLSALPRVPNGRPARPLRFGHDPDHVAPYLLPDILPGTPDMRCPMSVIVAREAQHRHDCLQGLENGEIDLALIATEPPAGKRRISSKRRFSPIRSSLPPRAACRRSRPGTAFANLPKERILLLDEGHCFRDQAIDACALSATADV